MAHVNGSGETMATFLLSHFLEPFIIQALYNYSRDAAGQLCTGLPHAESKRVNDCTDPHLCPSFHPLLGDQGNVFSSPGESS